MQTGSLTPLAGANRDVLGPIVKTVKDAALALDVMTGYGTPVFIGKAPAGGYSGLFGKLTLEGKKIGLYGTGWENLPLTLPVAKLYATAIEELKGLGATVVKDTFKGVPPPVLGL
jgi:amidase